MLYLFNWRTIRIASDPMPDAVIVMILSRIAILKGAITALLAAKMSRYCLTRS